MSVSNHPIALRLERQVGGATKLLATVMGLPLVDGIFPALVIAGALTYPWGILQTGLLIFGGSATVAVILAEMEGTPREKATSVLLLGAVLIPVAVIEAAFAETLRSMLSFEVFHRFAGLVILAIAAKTASAEVGEYLPSPGAIIGLGLIASFQPAGAELVVSFDTATLLAAAAAAGTGIAFALGVALAAPQLRGSVDIDLFRFGSAVALGMLALEVLGLLPTEQPVALGVLAVTALFSFDPEDANDADAMADDGSDDPDDTAKSPGFAVQPTGDPETRPTTAGAERDSTVDGYPAGVNRAADGASADGGSTVDGEPDEEERSEDGEPPSAPEPDSSEDDTPERPPYL
jgi:hypothetical protein